MTYPDTVAVDRRSPATWDAVLRPAARLWDWCEDPLERVMLIAVLVVSAGLLLVLATQEDADVLSARDECVLTAVADVRAFAAVLGDDRPVPYAFARRSCEQR